MIFGRGGAGGVHQPRDAPGRLGTVAGSGAADRLVGQQAADRRPRPGRERGRGRARARRSTRTPTRIATASTSSATASIRPWPLRLGPATTLRGSYEFFHDERVADRGIPSFGGRPVDDRPGTFFGDPDAEHVGRDGATCCRRASSTASARASRCAIASATANYDKFYQNVFPGAVNAAGTTVAISAYNNATDPAERVQPDRFDRRGADRPVRPDAARRAPSSDGRTPTTSANTGFFTEHRRRTSRPINAPLSAPTISAAARRSARTPPTPTTTASRRSPRSTRRTRLRSRRTSRRSSACASTASTPTSRTTAPRPTSAATTACCRRASGSSTSRRRRCRSTAATALTYLPRAGEQLSSLSLTNQALDPEEFRNYEVGAKWDIVPALAFTAALYRLDRGNVVVPDRPIRRARSSSMPSGPRASSSSCNGNLTRAWSVVGGYAYQDGEITRSISATAQAGATLAQVPEHSFSLWNRYKFTPRVAAALGHRLPRRHVHVDRQPRGPAGLDPRRWRGLLQRHAAAPRAGQRREPVRRRTTIRTRTATPTSRRARRGRCESR